MRFADLIVWGNTGGAGQVASSPTTSAVQALSAALVNLDVNNTGSMVGVKYVNFKTPSIYSGSIIGGYSGSADSLTNVTSSDWQLTSASACVNVSGATTSSTYYTFPTIDINQNARVVGTTIDLGAFEFESSIQQIPDMSTETIQIDLIITVVIALLIFRRYPIPFRDNIFFNFLALGSCANDLIYVDGLI